MCLCVCVCVCVRVCVYVYVCMCVHVHACMYVSTLGDSGMIWTPIWLDKLYNFYIAAIAGIDSRYGLSICAHPRNQPNKR